MLYNIQALRAIAALLVVFFHARRHFQDMGLVSPVFEFIARYGFMGVDIFFVISGYVMAKTSQKHAYGTASGIKFLKIRLARIYLGYWPFFILAAIVLSFNPTVFSENINYFQSFFLLNTNISKLVIGQAWTLSYEIYFYFMVTFLIVLKFLKPTQVLVSVFAIVLLINISTNLEIDTLLGFFFSSYLLEFISGYLLFTFWKYIADKKMLAISVSLFICAYLIATYFNVGYDYKSVPIRVATFGTTAFALVWTLLLLEKNNLLIIKGILKPMGDASYTLYLCHFTLLGLFYSSGLRAYLVEVDMAAFGFTLYVFAIIIFSLLFYKFIELPLYKKVRAKL